MMTHTRDRRMLRLSCLAGYLVWPRTQRTRHISLYGYGWEVNTNDGFLAFLSDGALRCLGGALVLEVWWVFGF